MNSQKKPQLPKLAQSQRLGQTAGKTHAALQPKSAPKPASGFSKLPPKAPPVYKPQRAPMVAQPKKLLTQASAAIKRPTPAAPPVYKPGATKSVQPITIQPRKPPAAPPVYRPEQKKLVQPTMVNANNRKPPQAPPVYRPQPVPKVLQRKRAINAPQPRPTTKPAPRVIQRLLMFAYPSGVIFDRKNTTAEDAERFGKVAVTHRGITVWTDSRNRADTIDEIERQYETLRLAYGVREEVVVQPPPEQPLPQKSELDLVDENRDVSVVYKGKTYRNCLIYKRKGWTLPTGSAASLFVPGKLFCITEPTDDEPNKVIPLTQADIDRFWSTEQYKADEGYTMVSGSDWRANCAGYALGRLEDMDTDEAHRVLSQSYSAVGNLTSQPVTNGLVDGLAIGPEYIVALRTHFIKLFRQGDDAFTTIEKNSSGPVFTKNFTKSVIKTFVFAMADKDRGFTSALYRKN